MKIASSLQSVHTTCTIALLLVVSAPLRGQEQPRNDTTTLCHPEPIREVVVTGRHQTSDLRPTPMSVTVIDRKAIDRTLRSSLLPMLNEQVPGLFTTSRGVMGYGVSTGAAGGMNLRGIGGSPTTGLLVVIDGQPQYAGLMGHPIADAYQTQNAQQVEVIRGPASVLYGSNAMGGVIHITTRKGEQESNRLRLRAGYGSYNTLESSLRGSLHRRSLNLTVGGLYNRTDGHRSNMSFEQYGGSMHLGITLTRVWQIAASGELTHFDASNPGSIALPLIDNDSRITRGRTALRIENRSEHTSGSITLFCNWGRHRINDGYHLDEEPLDYRFHSKDNMWGISLFERWQFSPRGSLLVGADYFRFGGRSWNRLLADGHDELTADKQQDEVAAYADWRQELGRRLYIDLGVRLDHHFHVGTEWVPQASLTLLLGADSQLRAILSKGFRFPTIREMYLFPPQNPDLEAERIWSYEIAFSQRMKRVNYGINLFYIDGKNRIQTVMEQGRPHNVNTGRIENWGAECEVSLTVGRSWSLTTNYSFLHMRFPLLAAPEHKLNLGAAFSRGIWSLQTGVQYVAGLYTELASATSAARTEEFMLWNLRTSVILSRHLSLWLRGENLLGSRYEINAGFPMPKATVMGGIELGF